MSTATTLQIDLTGKRALVTGGTRGIGKGITDRLRAAGATVVVAARSAPRTPSPQVITADIATADGSATIAERTLAILGGVDIVVHNVGGSQVSPGSVTNLTDGDWNQAFQINLFGAALAVLWATGSLGPVYRWLVVLRSHSISRAVSSETARYCCRSSELISRVFYEPRIVQARNGFQLIRIAVRLHPPPIAMPCLLEDDEVVRRRRRDAAPHTTEADHVCTKHHHPGAALVH